MNTRQIRVKQGLLEGEETLTYAVYKGIPYARPPVGALRFRAPQRPEDWEGVRDATTFSHRAWQMPQKGFYAKEFYSNPDFMPEMDEDCLYLNIWTPLEKSKNPSGYPVAFWIHGGAFINGFGSEMEFDGAEYAKRGVILVTINYRLGAFGFLALPELAAEDDHLSTGNYGILDQIAALKWVHENIGAFGGNPENITIFGQSAGAMSVQTLCNSPLTKGLFARAIMQSGGGIDNGLVTDLHREQAYDRGRYLMKLLKVSDLRELRDVTPEKIMKKIMPMFIRCRGIPFSPMYDGYVLPGTYDGNAREGKIADVPYMLGSNRNDLDVKKHSTGLESGQVYQGCLRWAEARKRTSDQPVYLYYFTRQMPGDKAGAFHSAELWYVFGTLARCWRPVEEWDYEISTEMIDAWTNFMKYSDPNGAPDSYNRDAQYVWLPYTSKKPHIQEFG